MPIVGTSTESVTMRATPSGTHSSTMREAAGLGQRDRVVDDRLRGVELLALHLEAAERVDRLRREPDVAHHRDLGVEDRGDRVEALATALELHRAGAGPDELGRVVHGLVAAHVVAEPRQVADDRAAAASRGRRRRRGAPCRRWSPAACRRSRARPSRRESPTRIMSTPAASTTRADGASYAVTITSGVP